jgi:hypothetical protein
VDVCHRAPEPDSPKQPLLAWGISRLEQSLSARYLLFMRPVMGNLPVVALVNVQHQLAGCCSWPILVHQLMVCTWRICGMHYMALCTPSMRCCPCILLPTLSSCSLWQQQPTDSGGAALASSLMLRTSADRQQQVCGSAWLHHSSPALCSDCSHAVKPCIEIPAVRI